jgi:hypothetical protein
MDHPLGNALMIEVEDLFAEVEVVDQGWTAGTDPQHVLVVGDRTALGGRQYVMSVFGDLMKLTAIAAMELLVMNCHCVPG